MTEFVKAQDKHPVVFNGPMRTGFAVDTQKLMESGYRKFQQELVQKLSSLYIGVFDFPARDPRKTTLHFDVDNYAGEMVIPRYLIRRSFSGDALRDILQEFRLSLDVQPAAIGDRADDRKGFFTISRLDICVFDFGYASATIYGDVVAEQDMSAEDFKSCVEKISSSFQTFNPLFAATLDAVLKAMPQDLVLKDILSRRVDRGAGELFWVHRIFKLAVAERSRYPEFQKIARAFSHSDLTRDEDDIDASLHPGLGIYTGHGNSAVVFLGEGVSDFLITRLEEVLRAINVFYAALEDCDHALFRSIGRTVSPYERQSMQNYLDETGELLTRISIIKSVYEDYDNQLDPQSLEVWQSYVLRWNMQEMREGISRKIVLAERKYDRHILMIQNLTSRRVASFLLALASFAAFAFVAERLGLTSGNKAIDFGLMMAILAGTYAFARQILKS